MDCLWLCHPHAVARAEYKPLQLKALRKAGLAVPRTMITNNHEAAIAWAEEIGGPIVCKQLSPVVLEQDGQIRLTYTTPVTLADVDPVALAVTAHCLQEQITDKLFEARVTMVGHDAYGVAIHADSEAAALDWRRDYENLRYEPFNPPEPVAAAMRTYLDAMNLRYGCFDLVATSQGFPTSATPLASTCGSSTPPECPSAPASPRCWPQARHDRLAAASSCPRHAAGRPGRGGFSMVRSVRRCAPAHIRPPLLPRPQCARGCRWGGPGPAQLLA